MLITSRNTEKQKEETIPIIFFGKQAQKIATVSLNTMVLIFARVRTHRYHGHYFVDLIGSKFSLVTGRDIKSQTVRGRETGNHPYQVNSQSLKAAVRNELDHSVKNKQGQHRNSDDNFSQPGDTKQRKTDSFFDESLFDE